MKMAKQINCDNLFTQEQWEQIISSNYITIGGVSFVSREKANEFLKQCNPLIKVKRLSDGELFEVHKLIKNTTTGETSIWSLDWYGRHVVGQDCEYFLI